MNDPFFDEDAEEYKATNKTKKKVEKTPEEQLKEDIYNRRCNLVRYANCDYSKFIQYILDNEQFFKTKMPLAERECMRRTCDGAWTRYSFQATMQDIEIFDRVFGPYIDPRISKTIPVCGFDGKIIDDDPYKLPIREQVSWFGNSTYESFWKWINNEDVQTKLFAHKELAFQVQRAIEDQIRRNYVMSKGRKGYEPSDDAVYSAIIKRMGEKDDA